MKNKRLGKDKISVLKKISVRDMLKELSDRGYCGEIRKTGPAKIPGMEYGWLSPGVTIDRRK